MSTRMLAERDIAEAILGGISDGALFQAFADCDADSLLTIGALVAVAEGIPPVVTPEHVLFVIETTFDETADELPGFAPMTASEAAELRRLAPEVVEGTLRALTRMTEVGGHA